MTARRTPFLPARGAPAAAVVCAALGAVAAGARAARAQATVAGTVRQPNGAPVAGAAVVVDGGTDTTRTDARGRFRLAVPPGAAGTLRASREGFSAASARFAVTAEGATRDVTLVLPALGQLAGVTVRAAAATDPVALRPLLDSVTATTGGSLSYAELRVLPTDNRDPLALAFTVPGAAQANGFFDTAAELTLLGSNSLYTQYYLDGFDNNEGVLGGPRIDLPLSALRRLDVRTSTYDVVLGRSFNGVVNEETLGGGDAWHGEAFVYGRPGGNFDARQAVLPPNTTAGYRRAQFGASLGGPLRGGLTRVFGAAEYSDETQDQPIATGYGNATGAVERRHTKLFGRLDQQWSATQSTTVHAAFSDGQFIGRGAGVTTPEADNEQNRLGALLGASHQSDLGPATRNVFGAQVAGYHWYYPPTRSALTTPQVTILSARNVDSTLAVVGASGFQYDSREVQVNLKDTFTHQAGAHGLSVGVDVIRGQFRLEGAATNLAGAYAVVDTGQIKVTGRLPTFADVPANSPVYSYSVDAAPQYITGSQTVYGAYAQDRWDVSPSVTFTYGLRWDYDDLTSRGASKADLTNFQPRTALNWRPDARTVVRGGFGVYSGKLPYTIYSDAIQFGPRGTAYVTFYNDSTNYLKYGSPPPASARGAAAAALPPREIRAFFADGLKSPRSYQTSAGFERTFGPAWGLSVDGIWVNTINLPRLYDLNAVGRLIGPGDTTNVAPTAGDAYRPVAPVNGSYRALTTTQTAGRSTYLALDVTGRHQFSRAFTADASYVLSRARNNTEDINFASSNGENDFRGEYADAVNDRRHKVNVRGFYRLDRVRLSAVVDYQTGTPINRVANLDLLGTGGSYGDTFIRNQQRFSGVPRDGERLPAAFEVNPGVAYLLPTTGGATLELRAEAFNLLNRANYSGFPSGLAYLDPRTQVGRPGDPVVYGVSGRPRQLQFSARYVF
ncbi:TonB-dependent receptor [Gemmatimonadetes bacterium T265]|nr:TonB-dependent receptor [Gemmatimonadetes bacterium T265]